MLEAAGREAPGGRRGATGGDLSPADSPRLGVWAASSRAGSGGRCEWAWLVLSPPLAAEPAPPPPTPERPALSCWRRERGEPGFQPPERDCVGTGRSRGMKGRQAESSSPPPSWFGEYSHVPVGGEDTILTPSKLKRGVSFPTLRWEKRATSLRCICTGVHPDTSFSEQNEASPFLNQLRRKRGQ